jgi:hypothetical protein
VCHTQHRGGRRQRVEDLEQSAVEKTRQAHERGRTTVLSIPLFHVAQTLCELLDRYILVVLQQIFLRHRARIVDERVGIGRDPGDTANHVSVPDDRCQRGTVGKRKGTHELRRNIFSPLPPYPPPSLALERSRSLPVTRFSAARTTPSLARTPRTEPAWEMASIAYSTVKAIVVLSVTGWS